MYQNSRGVVVATDAAVVARGAVVAVLFPSPPP